MAEEQKNVEVAKDIQTAETAPAVTAITASEPVKEEIVTDKPVEETKPVETAEETKPAEVEETKAEEKAEVKPIEEGQLSHKAQGASFPKNFLGSKEFFFFGTDAFEKDALSNYTKSEKSPATAQANISWATETGKGLLFSGDKKAPTGIINLSDASEPETEGANKFTLTSKGNKHSFKAANAAERDNWVAQLKLKIAEAKELATTVTESEKYKTTLESYKPKPVAKKEETPAVAAAEAPKEETAAATEEPAKVEEPVKEAEATKEEDKTEEPKKAESPKPLKNKRASFFGFLDKKDKPAAEEKKEEAKVEEPVKTEETPVVAPAIDTDKPAEETPAVVPAVEADKPAEEPKAESPKEKASKRNSFFGGILSKKEKKATEPKAEEKKEEAKVEEPAKTEEAAPVIPPVEATTPLAVDVNNPATTPAAETTESAAATEGEAKKDPKEKRKSSLPFLGKREKSPAPAEGEDKSSKSAFSKFRATIKGKSAPKEEKKEETKAEEVKAEEAKDEPKAEDKKDDVVVPEPAKVEPVADDAAKPVEAETETKPENVATSTPAVTAAA